VFARNPNDVLRGQVPYNILCVLTLVFNRPNPRLLGVLGLWELDYPDYSYLNGTQSKAVRFITTT